LNARQNSAKTFEKFEDLLERLLELPFELFPIPIESIELGKKLCKYMGQNRQLRSDGRQTVPNVYDIYVSTKDLKNLTRSSSKEELIQDWIKQLIAYAGKRNYLPKGVFVLDLLEKPELRVGKVEFQWKADQRAVDPGTVHMKMDDWIIPTVPAEPPARGPSPAMAPSSSPVQAPIPHAKLTSNPSQGNPQVYRIDKPRVSIGRQLDNDVIVPDKNVGRYHAVIEYQKGQFVLKDLKSTNGTVVNNVPVIGPYILHTNDVIMIGKYEFLFERR
jgi:FHA domain/Protein of unknown function (DUF3662)